MAIVSAKMVSVPVFRAVRFCCLWFALGLVQVLLASCAAGSLNFERPPPPREDHTVGPGDVFAIRVFGEPDLSQDYRVAPNGTINFPYLGSLQVQGMEPPVIETTIRERLRADQILRNPQVSVMIREYNSRRVTVTGQVQHPGTFPFEQNMDIVRAITAAGGFNTSADATRVLLTRRLGGNRQRPYPIPVNLIVEGRASTVPLAPGDLIYVPERGPFN